MKRSVALLLAAITFAGCSTVGNVFKKTGQVLMNPSIQVGSAENQPTQIALSLFASPDVNPNPVSLPTTPPAEELEPLVLEQPHAPSEANASQISISQKPKLLASIPPEDEAFSVNLRSTSKSELVEHLHALLGYLQVEQDKPATVDQTLVPSQNLTIGEQAQPSKAESLPTAWLPQQEQTQNATDGYSQTQTRRAPDLGQYNPGAGLGLGPSLGGTSAASTNEAFNTASATPISFQVLQLQDDSMLENADPELLRKDPKKALGSTFVSSDDYVLVPGQFKFIEFTAIEKKTRYIAVVANFHDPNAERWHDVFRIESYGRKYPLMVMLKKTSVAITDESYRPTQNDVRPASQASTKQ